MKRDNMKVRTFFIYLAGLPMIDKPKFVEKFEGSINDCEAKIKEMHKRDYWQAGDGKITIQHEKKEYTNKSNGKDFTFFQTYGDDDFGYLAKYYVND